MPETEQVLTCVNPGGYTFDRLMRRAVEDFQAGLDRDRPAPNILYVPNWLWSDLKTYLPLDDSNNKFLPGYKWFQGCVVRLTSGPREMYCEYDPTLVEKLP